MINAPKKNSVTMTVSGADDLEKQISAIGGKAEEYVARAVMATGIELRGDIVKRYNSGPATGIIYQKSSPRRKHQASAPGEAPMTDTGRLANSTYYQAVSKMAVLVATNAIYGPALEFGRLDGSIKKRPAWVPASLAMEEKFRDRIKKALEVAQR